MANLTVCYRGGNERGEAGYWIAFGYDTALVEELKARIPHIDRRWDIKNKRWWVSEKYDSTLTALFGNFYALAHLQGRL